MKSCDGNRPSSCMQISLNTRPPSLCRKQLLNSSQRRYVREKGRALIYASYYRQLSFAIFDSIQRLNIVFFNRHFEWASEMRLASWRTQITRQSSAIRPIGSDTRKVFSPSSVRGERVTTSRAWTNHQLELTQSNQAENLENESRIWELPTADNVSVSNNYGRHSCLNN